LGVLATVAANVAFGARFGLAGEIISAWPAGAFLVSSEILLSMLRARPVADEAAPNVAPVNGVPQSVNEADEDRADDEASAPVLPMPTGDEAPRPTRTASKRKPNPEKLFAADIEAGKVPSIRAIKDRAHVGTDNARMIRDQLLALVADEATPQAA
jgi:hypothetical protein